MRIMVTGAAGYIGTKFINWLFEESDKFPVDKIYAVDNFATGSPDVMGILCRHYPRLNFLPIDITDKKDLPMFQAAIKEVDAVVHLAALVGAPICAKHSREKVMAVNSDAVRTLVDAMKPSQRLVYPNTNSGYGSGKEVDETYPMNPVSLYGASKCGGEFEAKQHPKHCVFRLATVFGYSLRMRYDLLVNNFVGHLTHCNRLELFEAHFMRNYVHILDVCRILRDAALGYLNTDTFRVFNFGNPDLNMSKWQLAQIVRQAVNPHAGIYENETKKDPDQRNYTVSNKRIRATGFRFENGLLKGIAEVSRHAVLMHPRAIAKCGNA